MNNIEQDIINKISLRKEQLALEYKNQLITKEKYETFITDKEIYKFLNLKTIIGHNGEIWYNPYSDLITQEKI